MKRAIMCIMLLAGILGMGGCTEGTGPTEPQLALECSGQMTLEVGESIAINLLAQDLSGEITVRCDNEEVAFAELQGDRVRVTARAAGETVLYVGSAADDLHTQCTLVVRESPLSVYLPEGKLVLRSNRTVTVKAEYAQQLTGEVTWTTSDASVATVHAQGLIGRVTSVARGECTVTVSCGSSQCTFTVIVGV